MEHIGHPLGTLLEVDENIINNDSYLYARIKLVAIQKMLDFINLKLGNSSWKQSIEVEDQPLECMKCGFKNHSMMDCRVFVRPAKVWRKKENVTVSKTTIRPKDKSMVKSTLTSLRMDKEVGEFSLAHFDQPQVKDCSKEIISFSHYRLDLEVENDRDSSEDHLVDELDNIEARCISQLANILLGKAKGGRGSKLNRRLREDRAKEKGIVGVLDFMKKSKGRRNLPWWKMKISSWNFKGLATLDKKCLFLQALQRLEIELVLVQEIKLSIEKDLSLVFSCKHWEGFF